MLHMTPMRRLLLGLGTILGLSGSCPAHAAEIWFRATEPVWRSVMHWAPNDYYQLFQPDAPWQHAAADVAVFNFSRRFILETPEPQLRQAIDALKRLKLKVAMQATPLTATTECGRGVESFGTPTDMHDLALKLSRLGAEVSYVTMDEPLWYGHEWNGKPGIVACHLPIAEIARQTAEKMRQIRSVFPNVKIGDIEPMGVNHDQIAGWPRDLSTWIDAYRTAMGEPLDFIMADVVWLGPDWQNVLRDFAAMAASRRMRLAIIYNGQATDPSDAAWVDEAEEHFKFVEGQMGLKPAIASIDTWMERPDRLMPETERDTLTNLVLRYAAWQAAQARGQKR